jgi:hypothetical protein
VHVFELGVIHSYNLFKYWSNSKWKMKRISKRIHLRADIKFYTISFIESIHINRVESAWVC